jgi:hypothetical protein
LKILFERGLPELKKSMIPIKLLHQENTNRISRKLTVEVKTLSDERGNTAHRETAT